MAAYQELSNEQLRRVAPSIFATEAYKDVSDKYAFIPTIDVVEALRKEGFFPVRASQSLTRIAGKGEFAKHMLRFRRADDRTGVKVFGAEIPEVVMVNSHDRSSSFQLSAGIFRFVCSNGMTVKSGNLGDISVRHIGNITDEVIEGSYKIISDMPLVMEQIKQFKGIELRPEQQLAYASAAMQLRYPDVEGKRTAPILDQQLLQVRRLVDNRPDLWTTFNRVQENFIKGGLAARTTTNKRTTTRKIASVTEDLRLNKALWLLTEKMAELAS